VKVYRERGFHAFAGGGGRWETGDRRSTIVPYGNRSRNWGPCGQRTRDGIPSARMVATGFAGRRYLGCTSCGKTEWW